MLVVYVQQCIDVIVVIEYVYVVCLGIVFFDCVGWCCVLQVGICCVWLVYLELMLLVVLVWNDCDSLLDVFDGDLELMVIDMVSVILCVWSVLCGVVDSDVVCFDGVVLDIVCYWFDDVYWIFGVCICFIGVFSFNLYLEIWLCLIVYMQGYLQVLIQLISVDIVQGEWDICCVGQFQIIMCILEVGVLCLLGFVDLIVCEWQVV